MPNLKTISTLVRKAAPKIKEAIEVAKDIAADIKSGGKIYKETGMNTTEIRKYLKQPVTTLGELHDTKQFIWKRRQINPSRSVGRSIESAPKGSRLRNIAADYYKRNRKIISGENRTNLRHFRDEVDLEAPRIRQPASIRETQAAFDQHLDDTASDLGLGHQDSLSDILDHQTRLDRLNASLERDALTGDPSYVSPESNRLATLEGMSTGMIQSMEGVVNRARAVDRAAAAERRRNRITEVENFGERRERATNEGFEQYIRRKYGRNPTRVPDED